MGSDGLLGILKPTGITLKSLRDHRLLSLKLPVPETKTRPELALWCPTHSDLISESAQRASSQHGELPPSFLPDPRNHEFLPGGVSELLPLQRVLT